MMNAFGPRTFSGVFFLHEFKVMSRFFSLLPA
jgi:hypothetical protein